jgi:hypothetical protein
MWVNETRTCFAMLFLSRATAPTTGGGERRRGGVLIAEEDADPVRWRITGSAPYTLWVTGIGARDPETEVLDALVVEDVRYLDGDREIAHFEGSSAEAWNGERFAVQHSFNEPGVHTLKVRLEARPLAGGPSRALWSAPLEIEVFDAWEAWIDEFPAQGSRNLLRDVEVEASVSSQHCDLHKGAHLVDGLQSTAWVCANGDPDPRVVLELRPAIKADRIVFSGPNRNEKEKGEHDRPTKVSVRLNRGRDVFEVDLLDSDLQKTIFELPRTLTVRQVEILFLERTPGKQKGAVGFCEIELLRGDGPGVR